MRVGALFVASVLAASTVHAGELTAELQIELQTAMLTYMDSVLVDGGYSYVDTKNDALTTVYPTNLHPFVVPLGEDYFVCSGMIDENGNEVTADYLVRRIGDEFRVVQMIVNDRESVQGAMSKLDK